MCTTPTSPRPPRSSTHRGRDEQSQRCLERISADVESIAAIARAGARTIVIVVYLGLALWLLAFDGRPEGFVLLLPWALWSRTRDQP
ncbi:MAG TPA: hypothetical protein VHT29_00800 [Solirubrobacteraceae bacterium]|jgi:hypothetical protein|nr:hypothetical protein [Solirubrobacteraceae bacterium]